MIAGEEIAAVSRLASEGNCSGAYLVIHPGRIHSDQFGQFGNRIAAGDFTPSRLGEVADDAMPTLEFRNDAIAEMLSPARDESFFIEAIGDLLIVPSLIREISDALDNSFFGRGVT